MIRWNILIRAALLSLISFSVVAGCSPAALTGMVERGGETGGAGAADAPEKKLSFYMGTDQIVSLDPQLNSYLDSGTVILNLYEGLMRLDDNDKAIPGIAERYEVSSDGLVYIFYLRDALWSDGAPVKAQDFEYAWKRGLSPQLHSDYAFQLYYLKGGRDYNRNKSKESDVGVRAIDDKTLEVRLEKPVPYFLELTATFTYMPVRQDIVESDPKRWSVNPDVLATNGPFQLQEFTEGKKIVLTKNNRYYQQERIQLQVLELLTMEPEDALMAYDNGKIDALSMVMLPVQSIEGVRGSPEFKVYPNYSTYFYRLNTTMGPFRKAGVRRAFSLVIQRQEIVDTILHSLQRAASGIVPPEMYEADGVLQPSASSAGIHRSDAVAEARRLLAEAGYPNGAGFPEFTITYYKSDKADEIATAVCRMLKRDLNIVCTIKEVAWLDFQDIVKQGRYTMASATWYADYVDPMTFLDIWTSDSVKNYTGWSNPRYDRLIQDAKSESGYARTKLMRLAEESLIQEAPVIPVFYNNSPFLVRGYVKRLHVSGLGIVYFDAVQLGDRPGSGGVTP